ncbi:MAG: type I glutamate--ammonia ligase [Abitibacteriaceae bacterium]|nr:type I glutamate--ammonia ligase [Abditibacteriaceae bacterium]MBV9868698.1 type I glutamate--ammonia ligase [Abditibacteriaceae bacterium]
MADPKATAKSVLELMKKEGAIMVDIKFTDLLGAWQHTTIPAYNLDEDVFEDGIGFDGSSIKGFQTIDQSDMLLKLDPTTAIIDPVMQTPTLSVVADVYDPLTLQPYSRDPRYVAKKAITYLQSTGIADKAFFGPEAEFFLFSGVSFGGQIGAGDGHHAHYRVESAEGEWNNKNDVVDEYGIANLGYRPRNKGGYFPVPPSDSLVEVRNQMVLTLEKAGVKVDVHHHEVASGGQGEIGITFDTLVEMADKLQLHKYIVKNVARQNGLTATFMPKPIFGDNGTGMHCHQSLWKGDQPLFFDANGYAQLSDTARWYIGGILKHAPALLAFTNASTNSYHRLVPGYEAPIYLLYSQRNRSAAVRIPLYSKSPKTKRIEFRTPDVTGNIYLSLAAQLMAGLDGIKNKIDPGDPLDKDLYELEPEERHGIPTVPGSLDEVLSALQADSEFLMQGDVFTSDLIEHYLALKQVDVDAIRLRPHPWEYSMYFDV